MTEARRPGPAVVKLGGELLEEPAVLGRVARRLAHLAEAGPLVVVHGGGREVSADLARRGIPVRAVDGLRITDGPTLDVVVGVLAGQVNTRLVAALAGAGASAGGLTAAAGRMTSVRRASRYRAADGTRVDLGFVGQPVGEPRPRLVLDLCRTGHLPVVASIGASAAGQLFNVNADTLAGHLAAGLGASRLVIAGGTAGVLDADGRTIPAVDEAAIDDLIGRGRASAGMVAKLIACRTARRGGVREVVIVDGRRRAFDASPGTTVGGPIAGRAPELRRRSRKSGEDAAS
ncbi:MAG: acetylglutamate kinase [Acidobacteria bacterium]|nr:acetylglutamate kinase [Acidobacteriota bacterium]